jgi:peptide/nickel transport system permease protein
MIGNAETIAPQQKTTRVMNTDSERTKTLRKLVRNRGALVGFTVLAILILIALFAPLLAPDDPLQQQYRDVLQSPSLTHPFGTDQFGRDILSRIIIGARQSLLVAALAIAIAASVGITLGLLTGYMGGWVDMIIQRLIDIQLAFPGVLFALAVVTILGPGLRNAMIAVGISLIPSYARMVRGAVISTKDLAYIDAARVLGAGDGRIVLSHILPNILAPIVVLATVSVAWAILIGSSLSFLGLGAQLPNPEWGLDLSASRDYLREAWWMSTFPGLAIMLTVISTNLLGEGLREVLDPRLRAR